MHSVEKASYGLSFRAFCDICFSRVVLVAHEDCLIYYTVGLQVLLSLAAVLVLTRAQGDTITHEVDTAVQDAENRTSKEIEDDLKNFFHDSRNKLYLAFYNLSSYLPLDIDYAETVGKECDILKYNKDYYTTVGLILAGVLAVVGVLFAFFGEWLQIQN